MTIEERIAQLNKDIRKAENTKIQAETRLETLEDQYGAINAEFEKLGIDPKDAVSEKERIEEQMAKLEEEINELLPKGAIQDYK